MYYSSPALDKIISTRQNAMRETKTIIQKSKLNAPVLSVIIDYGGSERVGDLLHIQPEDTEPKLRNNFQKILIQSQTVDSAQQMRSNKMISFIDYKAQPRKTRQTQKKSSYKKNERKTLKTSLIVEMPEQLKQLKNQILSLPSVHQSRMTLQRGSDFSTVGSRLLSEVKKSKNKRYQTEIMEQNGNNRFLQHKRNYLKSLNLILQQFDSPQIKSNSYIMNRHRQCKTILKEEQQLQKQYKRFENLGSPPKKIIQLKNLLRTFQKAVQGTMDSQLVYEINNMDKKRYDTVLKHEQQIRKLNMAKFQQRKKQEKVQQYKNSLNDNHKQDILGFKLNSKGKQVYNNRNKIVQ